MEQYKDKLGMKLKEESKAAEYIEKVEMVTQRYVCGCLQMPKNCRRMKVFFLEDKERQNKDETKKAIYK
jgi:hypothetical protein